MIEPSHAGSGRSRPIYWARNKAPELPPHAVHREGHEFTHLQYTAVDVRNPKDFPAVFPLWIDELAKAQPVRHKAKITIVVTMYSEGKEELEETLAGICDNVRSFCIAENDETAWQKIVLVVVSDGRTKANPDTLDFAENVLGCFNRAIVEKAVDESVGSHLDVQLHMFERSIQILDRKNTPYPPLQIIFALKEHNAGKLDSHRWYFNAITAKLSAEYTILLDVGTVPEKRAIYKLFRAMERHPEVGGCCGEITVNKYSLNPIVGAQIFEYKIANLMDKALESSFGFVSVLPGAFSGYRYAAIRGEPLDEYFRELDKQSDSPLIGNMYLAEDRILCFALIAREGCAYTLHYVKNAVAKTDVPETLDFLIKQRRRWNNGAFFAMLYSLVHFGKFWKKSSHSVGRKIAISILFFYYLISMVMGWFLMGTFYLSFFFLVKGTLGEYANGLAFIVPQFIYFFLLITNFVYGLGNKPDKSKTIYLICVSFFAGMMILIVGCMAFQLRHAWEDYFIIEKLAVLITVGGYFLAGLIHGEIIAVMLNWFQYTLLLPTFINVLQIYSWCNTHDLSWGTRGLDTVSHGQAPTGQLRLNAEREKIAREKQRVALVSQREHFRCLLLLAWVVSNASLVGIVQYFFDQQLQDDIKGIGSNNTAQKFATFLFYIAACMNLIRVLGSIAFLVGKYYTRIRYPKNIKPPPPADAKQNLHQPLIY